MTTALPAPGTYLVDPAGSTVRFTTTHLWGLGTVRGSLAVTGGRITVAADRVEAVGTVAAASFDTGNGARDGAVRSARYLDAEAHPEITLRAAGPPTGPVPGELTVRGRTAPVELAVVDVQPDGDVLVVRLTTTVDRYAHGLTAQKGMTGRHLQLELTARATRA
ncbi:YceI family protein [Modestobacter versicolor]|uniref:Polyisoprenoid-binding protein YceI n=1 Tax=Modestobacter versicolor TaxID=429133 RepID=A0A323VIC8_9ACTN|nr:YceI family protein [Modestobacter versicolor]MBB3677208.1 polyisoprenoid-binding protein YceI [Modestobacter versicolor]PZA19848.1 YceI family protein [Modestobacter versicolor]